jgi:hypothetical protein
MGVRRSLVSWIGHADLVAMAGELPEKERARVLDTLKAKADSSRQGGPVRTLLTNESFDEIHLLSNYQPFLAEWFAKWLGGNLKIHQVKIANPTDYASIFRAADAVLSSIVKESSGDGTELSIHLSPGSPARVFTEGLPLPGTANWSEVRQ